MNTQLIESTARGSPGASSVAPRASVTACWIQHGGEMQWATQIARTLRDEGLIIRFVSFLGEMHVGYREQGFPSDFLGEIYDGPAMAEEELVALERRYGPPGLRTIGESDVHLKHLFGDDETAKVQAVGRALRFWERYFAEHRIGAVIVRDQAGVATRTARQVALRLGGIRMIQIGPGPDNTRFAVCDVDTTWNWSELDQELAKGPRPLDPARRATVEAFVAARVQPRRTKPMRLNLSVPHPVLLPLALWNLWREDRAVPAGDPVLRATVRLRRELLLKRGLWRALAPLHRFDPPPAEGEKFAYFPLFHTEESIHLLNIPYWARHVDDLAVALAEALPLGHKLYIKEHPAILGDVPYRTLRRLRRHPRIRLVAPTVQSQGLIAQAKAVIVLEGSAGWEAILLRRPCVVLAVKPFYAKCPLAFPVANICDINAVLPQAVAAEALYEERQAEWLWFIDCVLRTAPPGVLENYEFPHKFPATPENLRLVAAALGRKLRGLPATAVEPEEVTA
jgi:hypothetical protein